MVKPIAFSQVNSIDPLDSARHLVTFPTIQGVDGKILAIHHADVTIPNRGIAQVSVKYLGHSAKFRGSSQSDSVLSVSFIESSKADVSIALFDWFRLCRDSNNATSKLKKVYAQPGSISIFDGKGNDVITFKIYNMWPMSVTMPQLSDASGPVKYEVQFSVDAISVKGLDDEESEGTSPGVSSSNGSSQGRSGGGGNGATDYFPKSVGLSDQAATQLGRTLFNSSGNVGLSGFEQASGLKIGPFNLSTNSNTPLPVNALTLSQFTDQFSRSMPILNSIFSGF